MKILIVCPNLPYPPDTGAAIRIFNLIKCLSKENEIDLIGFDHGEIVEQSVLELQTYCKTLHLVHWSKQPILLQIPKGLSKIVKGVPFYSKYAESDGMAKLLYEITNKNNYDIIQFEHSYTAGNIKYLHPKNDAKTILATHNICYLQFYRLQKDEKSLIEKLKNFLTWFPMFFWEPRMASTFDGITVVSEIDKILLSALDQRLDISVVPNGVDTKEYNPWPSKEESKNILIVGSLDYKPNIDAVQYFHREILPLIRVRIPDCTLTIVGKNPNEEILRLGSDPMIKVKANVDDVRPYYEGALVSAVALRSGGGTRLKIIESMALGIPVVSTSVGCEGLDVTDRHNILIANQPQDFADKVYELFLSPQLREGISRNARKLVENKYDWAHIARHLQEVYEGMVNLH